MSYSKLYCRKSFKVEVNGQPMEFTCYSQGTTYGFRHLCTIGVNNTTDYKHVKDDVISKCCYYNRTWERYQFETVLRMACQKVAPKGADIKVIA